MIDYSLSFRGATPPTTPKVLCWRCGSRLVMAIDGYCWPCRKSMLVQRNALEDATFEADEIRRLRTRGAVTCKSCSLPSVASPCRRCRAVEAARPAPSLITPEVIERVNRRAAGR